MIDFYEILGVPETASATEVRTAYVRLAKERHPDRFSDPEQKRVAQEFFKNLTGAFNTLSNDRTRREYDEERKRPKLSGAEEIARDAFDRGCRHFDGGQFHEAVELLRTATQLKGDEPRYHVALSRALAKNPHWAREAIQAAEKAVELEPGNATYHLELALLFVARQLPLRARKAAETALRLNPSDAAAQALCAELSGPPEPPPSSDPMEKLRSLWKRKGS